MLGFGRLDGRVWPSLVSEAVFFSSDCLDADPTVRYPSSATQALEPSGSIGFNRMLTTY